MLKDYVDGDRNVFEIEIMQTAQCRTTQGTVGYYKVLIQ